MLVNYKQTIRVHYEHLEVLPSFLIARYMAGHTKNCLESNCTRYTITSTSYHGIRFRQSGDHLNGSLQLSTYS
jgi:hypothetical protein